jgi:hypothetical protein
MAMRGWHPEEVEKAVRQARRDALYLLHLQHSLNCRVLEREEQWRLTQQLLRELIIAQLDMELAVDRLWQARRRVSAQPYPLDATLAASVKGAISNAVETWASLDELETISEFVTDHLIQQGHRGLPFGAYTWRDDPDGTRHPRFQRPGEAEIRACFADEAAWEAFRSGSDYTRGLADVPDAVVLEQAQCVGTALHALIDSGAVQAGAVLRLDQVPMLFLQATPLLDGCWLDREVLALAEWRVELQRLGYGESGRLDEHPCALDGFVPPTGQEDASLALLAEARTRLAAFPGRTRTTNACVHVHVDDYQRWRDRRLKQLPAPEPGIVVASFNAWAEAQGGDGHARVAGVPVGPLRCWAQDEPIAVVEAEQAMQLQANRRALLEQLRPADGVDPEHDAAGRLGRAHRFRAVLVEYLCELYANRDAFAAIAHRYLGPVDPLYPESREGLNGFIDAAEEMTESFNRVLAPQLDTLSRLHADEPGTPRTWRIDLAQVLGRSEVIRALDERFFLDHARAETLDNIGRGREGQALMAQYLRSNG